MTGSDVVPQMTQDGFAAQFNYSTALAKAKLLLREQPGDKGHEEWLTWHKNMIAAALMAKSARDALVPFASNAGRALRDLPEWIKRILYQPSEEGSGTRQYYSPPAGDMEAAEIDHDPPAGDTEASEIIHDPPAGDTEAADIVHDPPCKQCTGPRKKQRCIGPKGDRCRPCERRKSYCEYKTVDKRRRKTPDRGDTNAESSAAPGQCGSSVGPLLERATERSETRRTVLVANAALQPSIATKISEITRGLSTSSLEDPNEDAPAIEKWKPTSQVTVRDPAAYKRPEGEDVITTTSNPTRAGTATVSVRASKRSLAGDTVEQVRTAKKQKTSASTCDTDPVAAWSQADASLEPALAVGRLDALWRVGNGLEQKVPPILEHMCQVLERTTQAIERTAQAIEHTTQSIDRLEEKIAMLPCTNQR